MSTPTPVLPAVITGKFNIALTQSKFQLLANKADTLIYNEDNLEKIAVFLKDLRVVKNAIDDTYKEGKEESLKICQAWDAAKRTFKSMVTSIEEKPSREYTRLCQVVEQRKIDQQRELQRIQTIKDGITANATRFAQAIADCTTSIQLTDIERSINLEKTRKDKYGEFLEEAVARYSELNTILAEQKVTVREHERLLQEQLDAIKKNDEAKMIELEEKKEALEAKIEEAKTVVQETAINQVVNNPGSYVQITAEVLPEVKARRTTWKYAMVDYKKAFAADLLDFSVNDEKCKQVLKTLKDTDQLSGKTELVLNGIRYYEEKTY